MRPLLFLAVALALALAPRPGRAQESLARACPAQSEFANCLVLAQAAVSAQPRLALAAAGGAPLAGSASTVGMRLGKRPRVAVQLRLSTARLTVPAPGASAGRSSLAPSIAADGAVGLYGGLRLLPTIGGVGSLDLLGSAGAVGGGGHGFSGFPATAAIGARMGLLRESFTSPGISISAMVRRIGGLSYAAPADSGTATFAHIGDVSLRATVGKRLVSLGTLVGAGLDRTSGDVQISPRLCRGSCSLNEVFPVKAPLTQTRGSFFADLTWTSLVFNATAELGWQKGGSPALTATPTGQEALVRKGGVFGTLALRLTI